MAILHGIWIVENNQNYLFIWGEKWQSLSKQVIELEDDILSYPLAIAPEELVKCFHSHQLRVDEFYKSDNTDVSHQKRAKNITDAQINLPNIHRVLALPTQVITGKKTNSKKTTTQKTQKLSVLPVNYGDVTRIDKSSVFLHPWKVAGLLLNAEQANQLLASVPLNLNEEENTFVGGDLGFWSQITRWSFDLIARCKFLPTIKRELDTDATAGWQALLDSAIDSNRLEKFSRLMPVACRTYQPEVKIQESESSSVWCLNLPQSPQELITNFLNRAIDAQVRKMVSTLGTAETRLMASLPLAVRQWLQSLTNESDAIKADAIAVERLDAVLKAWKMPLQYQLAEKREFRTAFELHPPKSGTDWTLNYCLQGTDNPEFIVDAETIWQHPVESFTYENRTIKQPQESFLQGLGLASRLYPVIAPSLDTEYPKSSILNPQQAYEFIKSVTWRFEDNGLGVILPPSLANREGWANRLGLKVTAQASRKKQQSLGLQSLLNFKWELAIGGQTLSKEEFDQLVAKDSPLVEINGEWVELREQDIKTAQSFFVSRLKGKKVTRKGEEMTITLEDALRLGTGDTQTIDKLPVVNFEASGSLKELIGTLTNNQSLENLPIPENFQGELRSYQKRGFSWLAFLERWNLGACLADDMGLGKTIQFITFLLHLKENNNLENPTLLVCPTSVISNWEREVRKFAPVLKVLQYHGDKRPKGKKFEEAAKKYDLIVTSYSLVYRDLKSLQKVSWRGIVLDEAQNIKNSEAKQSKAVREVQGDFRIALTGTPVENRLRELWSILDFLNPGYLGNKQFFQRRFAMPIEKYGDTKSLHQLRSLVQPFILRRLKTDKDIIQDLPEKQENNVFCSLSPSQAQLYQKVVDDSLIEIESADGLKRRGMILALLIKLKQICNHPDQYLKAKKLESSNSGKLQRLEAMLEEVITSGDRALIFTQFAEWGKLLKPYLEKYLGKELLFLYGSTSKKQREEMIDRFQHDPQGPPIMILSLKAGGVGLNLTRANHVFHFDRWWNPAVENQATDRVFRIGQTRNVQVHKFVCTGTLEEKIHDMIESKKQLAEQVVGTGEEWLTELDSDSLRDLLILDRNAVIEDEEE
ncbi:MAG: DEAD/DEAH box helicase [Cyanobacteria bacterium P01_A01_bin.84]